MVKLKREEEIRKTTQHLFRIDRVGQKKSEGWRVVKAHTDRRQQGGTPTDLVLMEK